MGNRITYSRIKRFLNNRFGGEITENIKNIKEILRIVDNITVTSNEQRFWLLWYKSFLKDELDLFQKAQFFIPSRLLQNILKQNAVELITENDKLILKDIKLPLPLDRATRRSMMMVSGDSLLPYLLIDIDDDLLYSLVTIHMEGLYEYKSVRLEKGDIVIDAGANIGEFSALAGVKGCRAFAFEPIPDTIEAYLSKTAEWNPNVTICPYALSDKAGELVFSTNMGGSSFVRVEEHDTKIKVQAIDLDTFVEKNNLPSVDFIKADIEGAERHMLMGARKILKEYAPKISICTYHLPDDPKVLRELILDANSNYIIEEKWKKMYAYVPK